MALIFVTLALGRLGAVNVTPKALTFDSVPSPLTLLQVTDSPDVAVVNVTLAVRLMVCPALSVVELGGLITTDTTLGGGGGGGG